MVGETTVAGATPHVDAFVRKYNGQGSLLVGAPIRNDAVADGALAVAGDERGTYVAGYTSGPLPGQTHIANLDAFIRKYDDNGQEIWTRQFGTIRAEVAAPSRWTRPVFMWRVQNGVFPGQSNAE